MARKWACSSARGCSRTRVRSPSPDRNGPVRVGARESGIVSRVRARALRGRATPLRGSGAARVLELRRICVRIHALPLRLMRPRLACGFFVQRKISLPQLLRQAYGQHGCPFSASSKKSSDSRTHSMLSSTGRSGRALRKKSARRSFSKRMKRREESPRCSRSRSPWALLRSRQSVSGWTASSAGQKFGQIPRFTIAERHDQLRGVGAPSARRAPDGAACALGRRAGEGGGGHAPCDGRATDRTSGDGPTDDGGRGAGDGHRPRGGGAHSHGAGVASAL